MKSGAPLLAKYNDVRIASRQVQAIQMRMNAHLSQNDGDFLQLIRNTMGLLRG